MDSAENKGFNINTMDPELLMLIEAKQDDFDYRRRRDDDWIENYTLSRDKVMINRLTQRQTVNLPVMKTVLRTLMKDVDDLPVLYYENLDSDKQAEVFKNEYWKMIGERNRFEIQDIIDKRQVFDFGRSYSQWQVSYGYPELAIIDTQDILVPRYNDPTNINNNRHLIHTHIYVPLATLRTRSDYDQAAVSDIEKWYATDRGLIKAADNSEMFAKKNEMMDEMGVVNTHSPILGETWVELTQYLMYHKEPNDTKEQLYVYVEAENRRILKKAPLEKTFGVTKDNYWQNHVPYDSWGDEPEKQDWYSDGIADIVRPSARIVNVWFSQLVENRTMRSLGMNYYNSNLEGFVPQTWQPQAWGWFGIPVPQNSDIRQVFEPVQIPALTDSLQEMEFVIGMIEKASGATATEQGAQSDRSITLGEVQLALGEAKQRIKGMSKFYTQVWKDRGEKYIKLLEGSADKLDAVRIFKKGRMTDAIYNREITPKDWEAELGYRCRVWDQAEKNEMDTEALQKQSAIKQNMPDNPVVDSVYKRKLLEFGDYTPDEVNDAMKYEEQKQNMLAQAAAANPMMGAGAPMGGGQPGATPPQPSMQLQQPMQIPAQAGQVAH